MIEDKKILFLGKSKDITTMILKKNKNDICSVYKDELIKNYIIRKIFHLYYTLSLPRIDIWYGFKYIKLEKYNIIILFECIRPQKVIEYIRKKNRKCRIIYWLWDTVGKLMNPKFYSYANETKKLILLRNKEEYNFEIWSFDKMDCEKYGFFYNNQVTYKFNLKAKNLKYDCFFCGQDKGRMEILVDLANILKKYNIVFNFLIKKRERYLDLKKYNIEVLKNNITYEKMLEYISESKCIVDLVQKEQNGLSWRPLEAIFYRKKLITNFKKIIEYDFYNKNNIFILGEDNISFLKEFINSEYEDIPDDIVRKYTVDGWIKNFMQKNIN